MAAAKTHSEKQVQVVGAKQSKQDKRVVRTAVFISGLPALFCARYELPCVVEVDVSQTNICCAFYCIVQ